MRDASIAVLGVGQLGSLFADLLSAQGAQVTPIRRADRIEPSMNPQRVIVAVGEDDLAPALASLPSGCKDRVVLVQNELSPDQWRENGVVDPSIAIVWFEKKQGRAPRVVLPTLVAGPWARPLAKLLGDAALSATVIDDALLLPSLLDKNIYILVSNLAGLLTPAQTTTGALLDLPHLELTTRVFSDVLSVESARLGLPLDADTASAAMLRAFAADPDHVAAGRSAPARLRRTLVRAEQLGIDVPVLREIAARTTS